MADEKDAKIEALEATLLAMVDKIRPRSVPPTEAEIAFQIGRAHV